MSAFGLCVRCGQNSADGNFCGTCEDALLDAARHLVDYAMQLRAERDDLRQSVRDLERALQDCSVQLAAAKGGGTP